MGVCMGAWVCVAGVYCLHVGAMSLNGVGEAYVTASATPTQLSRLAQMQLVLAAIYLPTAAVALHVAGAPGLCLANTANMCARIAYAYATLRADTAAAAAAAVVGHTDPLPRRLPHPRALCALIAAAVLTNAVGALLGSPSERSPLAHVVHVGVGGMCLLLVGAAVWTAEPELLDALRAARRAAKHGKGVD